MDGGNVPIGVNGGNVRMFALDNIDVDGAMFTLEWTQQC